MDIIVIVTMMSGTPCTGSHLWLAGGLECGQSLLVIWSSCPLLYLLSLEKMLWVQDSLDYLCLLLCRLLWSL